MEYKAIENQLYSGSTPSRVPQPGVKVSFNNAKQGIRKHYPEIPIWSAPDNGRMDYYRQSKKKHALFAHQHGFIIEGMDDITPLSCPRLIKSILNSVNNTTTNRKLIRELSEMRTGYQRRTESQVPWFFTNVKEQQDITSSEIGITPMVYTPVNLVPDIEVNQKLLRRPTELSSGYKWRTHYDTRVQTLTVTQSKLFEKKKRTRSELNKLPIGHHWRTDKPQISSDHFEGQQDVSSSKTLIPPLVDTTNILVQKTTKGSFKEQQDVSLSETQYPPLTGTPTNLFKKKVSVKGLNKIQIRQPTRTEKPQNDEDFKKQQDISSSETLLLPSIPTKDLQSIKGITGHVRRTEMRERSSCNVKEQQDTSSSKISLPLISTSTSLVRNTTRCRMSIIGLNEIYMSHQKEKKRLR